MGSGANFEEFEHFLRFGVGRNNRGWRLHACIGGRGLWLARPPNQGRGVGSGAHVNELEHFHVVWVGREQVELDITCVYGRSWIVADSFPRLRPKFGARCPYS